MTESDRDKTIEVMAEAAYDHEHRAKDGTQFDTWASGNPMAKDYWLTGAKEVLAAYESHLQASGMAVVPVESADKIAALMDHEFHAGTRAGWDAAHADNPIEAFAALDKTQKERLSILAASPYGKAVVQEASAEARRAVANPNPVVKEKDA